MLEGYITPLLMSYIDKYVKNIKPSDLKLSFWGGDVVLRNLELRLDVLEKELKYPLKFKSGCIRELTVHIPWNAIASQSVEVTIKDIEFVIKLKDVRLHSAQTEPSQQSEDGSDADTTTQLTGQPAPADQAPGYLKGYITRISDNVILHVQNMVVKVIEEECDMMFTMNIGSVEGYTTDENWEKKFIYTDYFQGDNSLCKVCHVTDLAVNLHPIEGTYEGESAKEPFIQRCSFMCRTKSDYRGSVVVKETMNVFFETVEFCVDERQFCLYFHHLEWLLAMYYTSKRLKGRDDQQQPSDSQSAATPGMPTPATLGTDRVPPTTVSSTSPAIGSDQSGSPAGATNPRDQQQGWGSWMWSFLGDPEAKENQQGASSEHTSSATRRRTPNHSIAIFSKSVSVTLKVTHQMQVPMFYSVRSFTKPVLHINFTGCKAQLDQDPSTNLFLVSVGIMSIDASITGICPCTKKFPASWRASAASATEQVPVFSVREEETCDPQAILQGTLFDAPAADSPSSDGDLSTPSSPSEAFKAVWITYEYYDVSPSRRIEECTGTLNIGRVKAAISPDVIHRLQHFYEAFLQSQEANPKFSEGMVVVGDPTAETIFRIKLAGGETILTPNVHYLPTVKLGHRPTKVQKPSSSKTKPPKLPGLCATLSESSVHMVQPMYGGNASDEVPQRYQLHAKFCEIQLGPVSFRTLEGSMKQTCMEMFLKVPSLEASKHSKTHGQNESENAYLQLDVPEMSSTLSVANVSKLLFISGSWKADPATSSTQVKFNSPPTLHPNVGKLQFSVKNAVVTKSTSEHFSLLSVVLGECSGAIVEYSNTDKKLGQVSPFFKGPYDTQRWNKVNAYKQSDLKKQDSFYADERLIEFFVATPHNNCEENYFPAVQTTVSGFVVCLSPLLLTYVRHLPLGVCSTPQQQTSFEPAKSEIVARELPPGGVSTVTPSTSHSPTASMVLTTTQQSPQSREDSFIHLLKLYAAKVNIGSILIVMPTQQFDEALMTSATNLDHPLDLHILPALAASVSDPHSPALTAVLLSLPDIKLESAKSHVLDEPVPREGKRDTLPWDCSLSQLSLFTVANCKALHVIEPTAVKATLAAQQEGVGITAHTEKIALALSQKQISLLRDVVSTIEDNLLALYSSTENPEEKENGNSKIQVPQTPIHPPSHHSSPTYSTVTPSTLPVSSESTATSLVVYPGLSSLWIQVLVSKLAFHIYLEEPKEAWSNREVSSSVSSSYATPMTSPTSVSDADGHSVSSQGNVITKLSLEIDSASLQVDIQEKCMNVVFKVAIAEGSYLKWKQGVWVPCLSSEKLFSSTRSAIPDDLSQVVAEFVPAITVQIPTSPFHQSPTKQHRNFIFLDVKIPFDQPHKSPKIHLNMLPFEVVAWLPLAHYLHSLVAVALQEKPAATVKSQSKAGLTTDVASWPAVEISLECFRVVLPTQDYSSTFLLSVGGLQATSSVSYASPDVRYIVNSSLYRRLSLLSSEKKQPPLPVYQLDAYSISMWGLTRNSVIGSPKAHLYASSANLRAVYTPPLYWTPHLGNVTTPLYKSESANLACGHCVEVNLTIDLNLVLGIEQIGCVSDILASNIYTSSILTQREDEPLNSKILVQSTESSTPFKLLLTGGVIAVSMLSDSDATCGDFTINQSDLSFESIAQPDGIITPLLQASIYNPLCSIQSNESTIKCEISCFNAAVCYSDTPTSVSYADLLDGQTVPSLLSNQLLETRNGQPQGKNDLPASFLNLNWSSVQKNGHPDAVAALSLDVGRPTKLTFTPALIQETLKVLQCMSKVNRLGNDKSRDERESDPRDLHDTDTSQQTTSQNSRSTSNLELKFTTTQVLVELQLPVPEKAHLLEVDASLQGEGSAPAIITTEGFLLVWDNLTVTYPHQEISQGATRLTGDLHVGGLQLLVVAEGHSSPVILPMQLNCLFSQHLPSSTLDLPQVEVSLSCGLVQFNVSQTTVQLAMKAIKVMSDIATSLSVESGEEEPTRSKTGPNVETTVVQFTDDLRTGEFKYITENMDRPRSPDLGEIVFHLGNQDTVATMAWHYQEPRAIKNVKVLPVPFSITTEEDVPVDVKVVCGLEYWSDELNSYVPLVSFHVSEAAVTEVLLPPEQQVPSRRWRVCVNDVEWVDEEEGELLISKASVSDNSGSQVPLSSILSPLSLAASTQIDSYFSSSFIPLYTVNVHFQDIQATLLHSTNTKCTSGHYFRGYPIIHNSYDTTSQELLQMDISSFTGHLRQTRNSSMSLKLDGLVSMHFVDFRDLTWRTTIHPTNLNTSIETQKTKEAAHWSARSDTNSSSELTVAVKCSPVVVRVSQGLVHTTTLAAHAWSSSVDDNTTSKETTIFNQFILCNDTLEDLHIGQVSTDENLLLPSNTCMGYSWRSHKTSPPQALHACLVTDGVWRWTKPFDISTTGVQEIQLFVGINTATLYVHVTDLGGLQKQVTLCGSWKLCTSLPFALEAQLVFTQHIDKPWTQKQELHKKQPQRLSLTPGTSVPSIIAADNELAGVQVRISGVQDGWSIVYPLNSTAHDWNKPQLLAEVSTNSSETIHCWYNIKPMDSTDGRPWGNKITFAPLFAVCNHFPFDLILNIVATNADGHSSSLPSCVVPSRGMNLPLTNLSADTWYHLKFRISESTAISEPAVALSTYLLLQLPFSSHKSTDKEWPYDTHSEETQDPPPDTNIVAAAACKLTLPLEGGYYCSMNATILRSTLNTVTVHLKPETLVVNRCPLTVRFVEATNEEDEEESRERITDVGSMDVAILVHRKFTLCLPWEDQQLLSEPVILPTRKGEKTKDGKEKDHPTPLKVMLCNNKSSTNQVIGELLITFNWYDDMLVAAVKPNYIVYNSTSHQLSLWPCVTMNQLQSELSYVTATCLQQIAPGESKEVVFWHGEGVPTGGTTHALSLRESGKEAEETEWSIFISPNYVRYSFALPTCNSPEPFSSCVITTHEHESVTYIVIAHDPSPRLQIQNLCGAMVEVVASETNGIDAFAQPIPPGHQVTYEVPALAKLYPAVYDEEIASDFEKQLQKTSKQVSLSFRVCHTHGENENEGNLYTWSSPFPLTSDKDEVIDIPGVGSTLVSTHRQGNTMSISLLPTGMVSSFQPVGRGAKTLLSERKPLTFDGTITEFVLCLDDETSDPLKINEVLRIVGNDAELHYSSSAEDGTVINLAIRLLQVDNMSESSLGEFSVTVIPRAEHVVAAELIKSEPLPLVRFTVHYNPHTANLIDTFHASFQPVTLQLEDRLLLKCKSLLQSYGLPGVLETESFTRSTTKLLVVPPSVLQEAERDASPLIISSLVIEPTSFYLNAKISLKVLLSCNDSSFQFSRYELRNVYSNFSEVSQTISAHYVSMVIMQIGWLLGSLELIGSPGTFIQSVGRGLRDLVKLPYEGLTRSPSLFIVGIGQGTASFFRQFSSGALGSVTNLASSISRNMERLSMDPHHVSFQEQQRRERPATHFTSGLVTGISSFSLSLMSAVAGIVEQPMQSVHQMEASPTAFGATKSLLAGMGKGLIGAVAKPVGGAMELVSQTGQGLLHGTGLTQKLIHKAIELECYTGPIHRSNLPTTTTRCAGKLEATECLLTAVPVIHVSSNGAKNLAILLLTHTKIHLLDCESDSLQQNFSIEEYNLVEKGSPQVDEVELHLLQPSQSHPQKESPKFQPIEHYLQLSQSSSHELVISPQLETLESLSEEPAGDPSMVLLLTTHKAAQLLCVYHAVRQCLLERRSTFCIHASPTIQCHDSLLQKDSFYSCT